jgi:GTP pyrophosphokinase
VVELTAGATPIDFAYAVHTDLGHRCRGRQGRRRVVPPRTPLQSGQTVEITAAKSRRALARLAQSGARLPAERALQGQGPLLVQRPRAPTPPSRAAARRSEKVLQREGKTALKLEISRRSSAFARAEALFEVVGKDELSLRNIEALLRPAAPSPSRRGRDPHQPSRAPRAGGVGVVGVESLLTTWRAAAGRRRPTHRRLRDARQGRRRAPRRLHATCASLRARAPSG